jgi:hypothetical protein
MDAGRRYKTQGSETEEFITHSYSNSQVLGFRLVSTVPGPVGDVTRTGYCLRDSEWLSSGRSLSFGNPSLL